jgi:glutathione S-transferase
MKLYYAMGTCSLAPHIALREAGETFQLVRYEMTGGRLAGDPPIEQINEKGLVPVLELDDGQRLTEAAVVLQYIADRAPDRKLAPPAGSIERYRLMELLNFLATEVHKAFWPLFHGGEEVENRKAREKLGQSFTWLERVLGDRPFLLGDTFTVADAYLFTILGWTRLAAIDLNTWPRLLAYRSRLRKRPAIEKAMEAEGFKR